MNEQISHDIEASLRALRYGLLIGKTTCHYCRAEMPTAAVWVASFAEFEEGEVIGEGEGALLRYIEHLDATAAAFVLSHAPWMRLASTRTSGQTYYAHHCATCGALQGDHYVFSPDGPYWPQDDVALSRLRLIDGIGALTAVASPAESGWMRRVADVCTRE